MIDSASLNNDRSRLKIGIVMVCLGQKYLVHLSDESDMTIGLMTPTVVSDSSENHQTGENLKRAFSTNRVIVIWFASRERNI